MPMSPYSWRPSDYLCPHCSRRLESKGGPDGLNAQRCPNCDWETVYDPAADEFASDELERARLLDTETVEGSP
jgi:rubredoxin